MSSRSLLVRIRGFTLIEVLVSLAIMALIAVILIGAVNVGGRGWARVGRAHRQSEEVAYAERYLRQLLERIAPNSSQGLEGTERSLRFLGPAPAAAQGGLLTYELGIDEVAHALTVRAAGSATPSSPSEPETLIAQIEEARFAFWDSRTAPGHWATSWEPRSGMPGLIRIDVRFGPNDPREWPPLYIEPHLNTDAACRFDVVARRCLGIE